ncbi:serine-rich adhesin for platelets isoform X2 [Halyomorpha halys]|uniref:serine-rich adhesin for platelets isoform X2 n=1 Tax=Halyomorpha halys TaxID=286706 RepID=UPI0006D50020|nr:uncharacterized protein LOC106677801 isoform X2 [Halyomorpha halys]
MAERHLSTPLTLAFQERASAELCTLNSRLNDRLKQDITREVYNRNILKHKEDAVVAQIRILRGEKECDVGSPDSDVFVTPKASPSDPHLIEPYHGDSHKVYYSLVHFEEGSQQVLEKELAEQDELSNSFRSIIIKETRQNPLSNTTIKTKNPSKKDVSQKPSRPHQFNTKLKPYVKTKLVLKLQNQLDDMNRVQGIGQKEEDIMSNPDSCLEPVSSGYVTGCSPRDTNSSEALGADSTEVASSEDIPHDDKSRGSSSVSSDPGTWDSTFPTNDDDTFIEKENSENITKSDSIVFLKGKSTIVSTVSPEDEENTKTRESEADSAKCSEYMYSFSEKNGSFINLKRGTQYSSSFNNQEFSSSNAISNNFFIDAASLRDENEMYLPNIRNPVFPSTNIMQPKTHDCDEVSLENDKSDLDVRKVEAFLDKEPKTNAELNSIKEKDEVNRKLIRRNTFDLDPDDITLSRLKEEFEKSQNDSADADNSSNVNEKDMSHNYQLNLDKKVALHSPHEEDMHSPDSLNNDFHLDSFANNNGNNKKPIDTLNSISECEKNENVQIIKQTKTSVENEDSNAFDTSASSIDTIKINNFIDSNNQNKTSDSFISNCSPNVELSSQKTELSKLSESAGDSYCNKIERMPKISGGAQFSDLSSSEYSVSVSPLTRRKTEFAPILSGGFDEFPSVEPTKTKTKVSSSLSTSWVVDMSGSGKSPPESLNDNKMERNRSSNSGMGFFVPLDDPYPSFDSFTSTSSAERSDSGQSKKNILTESNSSCGFFIDIKENNEKISNKSEQPGHEKRLFSMFIDIGNSKSSDSTSPKSKPGSPFFPSKRNKGPSVAERLTAKHLDKKSNSTSSDSGLDLGEHPEIVKGRLLFNESSEQAQIFSDSSNNDSGFITKRQSFYMFIGNEESPVTRRRTLPSGIKQNTNRHSWNNDYKLTFKSETYGNKKEHKRSSSISYDESYDKERFSSGPSSIEDVMLKQREKNNGNSVLASWHGPIKPSSELSRIISNGSRHELKEKTKEIQKTLESSESEFPDKGEDMSCSIKSDDVFDISNATLSSKEDVNRTFVVDDVSKVVNINTNDLELSTPSHDIVSDLSKDDSVTDLIQDQKSTSSNATNKSSVCDVDQNTPKLSEHSSSQPALDSAGGFVKLSDMDKEPAQQSWKSSVKGSRMSRSIPEGSWIDSKIITNSASSRSLSRLFPHLYSKPESRDSSLQSSLHSSIVEPSPIEVSTEEEGSCTSGGPCSRLGEDLLRMFLDEISPDVTVEVGGRRIKAHKCILSSRCQYFAGMLSGGWVESAGNVISLQGFSYNTVHFALCHIYSGASQIPETINIVELATLADMLCLEGLKEVIMYTLKVKYCHFFHKPCSGCLVGVVECLPLAAAYSLDEIYRKSLRWITKHFIKIWPTKGFASLPKELHEKCYKQHTVHMSNENVLETVMGCDKLEATIPNVRWANPVFALNSKLHEATVKYIGQHFASILASQAFMTLGQEDSWTVTRLEETLLNVSKSLSPDQACQSYKRIKIILSDINNSDPEVIDWKLEFLELLTKLETSIEDCLIRQAGRAARTTSWAKMDLALRRRIQEAACLVFTPGPRPVSASRETGKSTKVVEIKPKSPAPSSGIVRKTAVGPSNQPPKSTQSPIPKPKTPSKLSQVKSRYLDPKPARKETPEAQPRRMSGTGKAISSSDSSRTSSPATARVSRPGTAERRTPIAGRRLANESSEATSHNFKENRASTSKEPDPKSGALKRQSTFRVATKSSSAKQVSTTAKQVTRTRTPSNLPTKTSVNNNKIKPSSVTTRSGTFHRDDTFQNKKAQQSN